MTLQLRSFSELHGSLQDDKRSASYGEDYRFDLKKSMVRVTP